jgi:hypothetical protein
LTTQQQVQLPPEWEGSLPEYIAFTELIRQGKQPGIDFTYQSPLLGGRMTKGGVILDFEFTNPPDLAVNIQGVYYHYEFGVDQKARDIMARAMMAGQGITLVFIDEDDLLEDPSYYITEALNYRDHSRMGRG